MKKILLFAISIISAISFANAQSVFQGTITGTVTQNTTPFDYTLNYMFTWNATDGTITLNANFDWANDNKPFGLEDWVHLYVTYDNAQHNFEGNRFDNGIINFTFSKEEGKFVEGETINVRFYWPGGDGVIVQPYVDYTVGSSSNDEPEIGIKIRETDIVTTSSSALILYDPEYPGNVNFNDIDYTVSYKDEANEIEGTSKDNPIGINGLKADTQYNMVFIASGTINGQTYTSTPQTVTFWTLKEGEEPETAVIYSGSKRGTHEQTIEGVTTNYDYTLNCEITYNADKTLSFNSSFNWDNVNGPTGGTGNLILTLPGIGSIVGKQNETCTSTNSFEEGTELTITFETAVANGNAGTTINYIVGSHNGRLVNGGDYTMQSAEINHRERTIKMNVAEGKLMATLYFDVPNNAKNLYYKVENSEVSTLALDGYKKADTYNGQPVINLPVPSKGQTSTGSVSFYQEREDGFATTPVTYTYTVAEETPTGVEGIMTEDGNAEFFNLNGVKVSNPENGIYIMVKDGKALKVIK